MQLRAVCAALLAAALVPPPSAHATPFTYQGRLDLQGVPFTGVIDVGARVFPTATPELADIQASALASNVQVVDGLFTAQFNFDRQFTGEHWIQLFVQLGPGVSPIGLLPLQRLTPAPQAAYALASGAAQTALSIPGLASSQAVADRVALQFDRGSNGSIGGFPGPLWQSFTAPASGPITRVDLPFVPSGGVGVFRLYQGLGTEIAVLAEAPYSANAGFEVGGLYPTFLPKPVQLVAGAVYTLAVSVPPGATLFSNTSFGYPGGRSSFSANDDFNFRLYAGVAGGTLLSRHAEARFAGRLAVGAGDGPFPNLLQVGSDALPSSGLVRLAASNGQGALRAWDIGVPSMPSPIADAAFNFVIADATLNRDPVTQPAFTVAYQTGFVGINTPQPQTQLDVRGEARAGILAATTELRAPTLRFADNSVQTTAYARLKTSRDIDFNLLTPSLTTSFPVAIAGAAQGDVVVASVRGNINPLALQAAYVQTPGSVVLVFRNLGSTALDPPAFTADIVVLK